MAPMWGNINICPQLRWFHIPSLTPAKLFSPTGLKAWGEKQKVHHNIAFLLVQAEEEATGDRKYGLLTIWVNPCQARVLSMEEAAGKLTTWVSSGPDWPLCLGALTQGHLPCTTPQGGALRHPTSRRGRGNSLQVQISQLEVCQLLISNLQVTYLIGLNGCEESIITSLPESLANSISLTRGKSIYLRN